MTHKQTYIKIRVDWIEQQIAILEIKGQYAEAVFLADLAASNRVDLSRDEIDKMRRQYIELIGKEE